MEHIDLCKQVYRTTSFVNLSTNSLFRWPTLNSERGVTKGLRSRSPTLDFKFKLDKVDLHTHPHTHARTHARTHVHMHAHTHRCTHAHIYIFAEYSVDVDKFDLEFSYNSMRLHRPVAKKTIYFPDSLRQTLKVGGKARALRLNL